LIGNHAVFAAYLENQMRDAPQPGFVLHFVTVVLPWCEGSTVSSGIAWSAVRTCTVA
jgi:hypothetical protein